MRPDFEARIITALANFRLPEFTEREVEYNFRDFYQLEKRGDEAFARDYGPRVYEQSGNTVRLVRVPAPQSGRIKGSALYFKLRRGNDELRFAVTQKGLAPVAARY